MPILSIGQSLKNNYYLNSQAGFSIKFEKDWNVKMPNKETNPVLAAKSKLQIISVGLIPVAPDFKPEYTQIEADVAKSKIVEALKAKKTIIDKISVTPGIFLGRKCLITIAHLTETRGKENIPTYHKTIQLVHKKKLFSIIYTLPLSKLTNKELELMEKQINTIKFL